MDTKVTNELNYGAVICNIYTFFADELVLLSDHTSHTKPRTRHTHEFRAVKFPFHFLCAELPFWSSYQQPILRLQKSPHLESKSIAMASM